VPEQPQPLVNISLRMEDVTALMQQNPLFAAQLQNVALLRMFQEKDAELEKIKANGQVIHATSGDKELPVHQVRQAGSGEG
jgi:hypothetical protein